MLIRHPSQSCCVISNITNRISQEVDSMKFIHFFTYMLTLKIGLVISGKGGRISIDGNDKPNVEITKLYLTFFKCMYF